MSFFYSDLPDDTVFFGTGILRTKRGESLSYPVQVSWQVHKHLFTFRMPWRHFSNDDINLELHELQIQTPQGLLTSECIGGLLKSTTPIAITSTEEIPLAEGFEPEDYDRPADTPCEWTFGPSSSRLKFSRSFPNEA